MDVTSISTTYDSFRIKLFHQNVSGSIRDVWLRFNADTGANYACESTNMSSSTVTASRESGQTKIRLGIGQALGLSAVASWDITVSKSLTSTSASVIINGAYDNTSSVKTFVASGHWNNTSSKITGISVKDEDGTGVFDTGSYYILE